MSQPSHPPPIKAIGDHHAVPKTFGVAIAHGTLRGRGSDTRVLCILIMTFIVTIPSATHSIHIFPTHGATAGHQKRGVLGT